MVEVSAFRPDKNSPNLSSRYVYDLIGSNLVLSITENYSGWIVEFSLTLKSDNPKNAFHKPYYKAYIWNGGLHQDTLDETILPIEKEDIFPNLVNFLHTQHPDIIRDVKLDDILDQ